jgi:hypothetical protein
MLAPLHYIIYFFDIHETVAFVISVNRRRGTLRYSPSSTRDWY